MYLFSILYMCMEFYTSPLKQNLVEYYEYKKFTIKRIISITLKEKVTTLVSFSVLEIALPSKTFWNESIIIILCQFVFLTYLGPVTSSHYLSHCYRFLLREGPARNPTQLIVGELLPTTSPSRAYSDGERQERQPRPTLSMLDSTRWLSRCGIILVHQHHHNILHPDVPRWSNGSNDHERDPMLSSITWFARGEEATRPQ